MVEEIQEDFSYELLDEDEAEYSKKAQYSKASVIQAQVQRCNEMGSKEMVPGYRTHIIDKMGNAKLVVIPDARQAFCFSVYTLLHNLSPEINREKEYKDIIIKFNNEKEEIKKKYIYQEQKKIRDVKGNIVTTPTGRSWLPKIGEIIIDGIERGQGGVIKERIVEGGWDGKVNAYWDEILELHFDLFADLNCLIDKNEYFKEKSGW